MTTDTLPTITITIDSPVCAVAAALRAAGPGVEIDLTSTSPWRYTIKLCEPSPVESSGVTIAERPVTVEIAAYAQTCRFGHLEPALRRGSELLGQLCAADWGTLKGRTRSRACHCLGRTLSDAVANALALLRGAAADAIAHADARAMAVAAEEARYAEALAR